MFHFPCENAYPSVCGGCKPMHLNLFAVNSFWIVLFKNGFIIQIQRKRKIKKEEEIQLISIFTAFKVYWKKNLLRKKKKGVEERTCERHSILVGYHAS